MIVVIGDLMLDVFLLSVNRQKSWSKGVVVRPGGSAANTAAWLAQLGSPVTLIGCVGDDEIGSTLVTELENRCVTVHVAALCGRETGCVLVALDEDGEHMRSTRGANEELAPEHIESAPRANLAVVHLTGYSLLGTHGLAVLQAAGDLARATEAIFSFDPSSTDVVKLLGAEILLRSLASAGVTMLLPNSAEAVALTGGDLPVADACSRLARNFPIVIVKDGPGGIVYSGRGTSDCLQVQPIEPLDTTGAGDAFNAGVLFSLQNDPGIAAACREGHRAAIQVLRQYGGRPRSSSSTHSGAL